MAKLTERQKRFIRARATTGDNTEAARLAGYKHPKEEGYRLTHAHRFMHVQEAIKEQNKRLDKDAEATRAHKRKHLKTIMDTKNQDPRVIISAISEDNKMTGDNTQNVNIGQNYKNMSDEEALKAAINLILDTPNQLCELLDIMESRGYRVALPK